MNAATPGRLRKLLKILLPMQSIFHFRKTGPWSQSCIQYSVFSMSSHLKNLYNSFKPISSKILRHYWIASYHSPRWLPLSVSRPHILQGSSRIWEQDSCWRTIVIDIHMNDISWLPIKAECACYFGVFVLRRRIMIVQVVPFIKCALMDWKGLRHSALHYETSNWVRSQECRVTNDDRQKLRGPRTEDFIYSCRSCRNSGHSTTVNHLIHA